MTAQNLTSSPTLLSPTWKTAFKIWTSLVMAIVITTGCRATSNSVITEPTTSDLSGIKGKYYQVFLTPANRTGTLVTFMVCPKKSNPGVVARINSTVDSLINSDDLSGPGPGAVSGSQLKQNPHLGSSFGSLQPSDNLCVHAFVDKDGQPITFSSRVLQNSDLFKTPYYLANEGDSSQYLHFMNKYRLVTVASGGVGAVVLLSNVAVKGIKNLPVIIAAPILYGASVLGGEKIRHKNVTQANNCLRSLSNIQASINVEDPSPHSEMLTKLNEAVRNECNSLLTDFWIQDTPNVTLTSSFQELISTDESNVKSVSTRIPNLLPILGQFVMDVKWTYREVAYQCLPKYTFHDYVNQQEPLCIPLRRSWNTGNPYMYKRPTDKDGKHIR